MCEVSSAYASRAAPSAALQPLSLSLYTEVEMEGLLKSGDYNALAEHCEQEELKVSKLQAREGIGIFMRVYMHRPLTLCFSC